MIIIYYVVYAKIYVICRVNFTQKLTLTVKLRVNFMQKLTLMRIADKFQVIYGTFTPGVSLTPVLSPSVMGAFNISQ